MRGLMQAEPLTTSSILEHAERCHGGQGIVSRMVEGPIHRCSYRELAGRSRRLANALLNLGMTGDDVIGTLAWNGFRHVEAWYAVTGLGHVLHTINPRLSPGQLTYIINHAEDRAILVDLSFVPLLESIADQLPGLREIIIMTDREHMPVTSLRTVRCYEELLEQSPASLHWPALPEDTASSLCYTSGTTGRPKGVLYSHRSNVVHALSVCTPNVMGLGMQSVVLPVVPMFHANAWGIIHAAPMAGSRLVLPGPSMDGKSLHELITGEEVDVAAAVPTVWQMFLQYLEDSNLRVDCLNRVMIAGSAVPKSMIEVFKRKYGVTVCHAWGMTELSPVGTINHPGPDERTLAEQEQLSLRCKQGRFIYGVTARIVDDNHQELPWNGDSAGHLQVRGPWIAASYYKQTGDHLLDEDRFMDTGDIGTIDANGYLQITDRAKDLIKSGGEWISSVELESHAMDHPDVALAAAIAIPDPKWDQRPILIVKLKQGHAAAAEDIREFVARRVARWQAPEWVTVTDEMPLTATGKINKLSLRDRFAHPL